MSFLRNFRIGARLTGGFAALLLMLCVVAGFGAMQTSKINDNVVDLSSNWLESVELLGELRAAATDVRRNALNHVLETEESGKAMQQAKHDEAASSRFPAIVQAYEKKVTSPEETKLFESIKSLWAAYLQEDKKLLELSSRGESGFAEAREFAARTSAVAFTQVMKAIDEDVKLNVNGAAAAAASAAASYRSASILDVVAVTVALAIGVALAMTITRSLVSPIEQAVHVAEKVALGDLSSKLDVVGKDEPARLLGALVRMNDSLVRIVSQVRHSSDSIATGSNEIATGNADLSQRTEEQAANLQQTAASMDQLTSTVKSNSDTAQQAASLAISASGAAEHGGRVVAQVVETMNAITSSSHKIADIIAVIDGIAFQTNILALNAAVEAARAGEEGRGFAVVASEVRSLAQRSAGAAKEIKSLINESVSKVQAGSQQVDDAGIAMKDIVAQVKRVNDLIGEISSASREQTLGIGQVGDAVTQLDRVTQQNAALVEESAAAADSLSTQAAKLVEAVSVFTLSRGEALDVNANGSNVQRPRSSLPVRSVTTAAGMHRVAATGAA